MKSLLSSALLLTVLISNAQYNYQTLNPSTQFTPDQQKLYTFENLRIYPVYAKQNFVNSNKNIGKYIPLKDALAAKKVVVTEKSASGTRNGYSSPEVNSLYIQNNSKDTVYIMAGEVVKGGDQDRMIATDVVLPPDGKKKDLGVYCVEHNRWTGDNNSTNTFNSTYGTVSMPVRKGADVQKDQSYVWSEVKKVNVKNKTETSTGTYTALTQSKDYTDKLNKYTAYFKAQLLKEPNIIGFAAATGDSIIGCDMFATNTLFRQQLDNLLQSYCTEAITNGKTVTVSNTTVKRYFDKLLLNEQSQKEKISKEGKEFKMNDKTLHITTY